jgi:hypothetical protein
MLTEVMVCASGACCVLICILSIQKVHSQLDEIRLKIVPYGWKYLKDGPRLGVRLSEGALQKLNPENNQPLLLLYLGADCSPCRFLLKAIPGILDEFPTLRITIVSHEPAPQFLQNHREVKHPHISSLFDQQTADDLGFRVAPFAVYLVDDIPKRKGIVNTLEQLRLLIEPGGIELDLQLR